jgi:hypothetical protein
MSRVSEKNWTKIVAAYEKRRGSRAEFCKEQGVSLSALDYHLRTGKKKSSFVQVTPEARGASEIVLELPGGIKLTVRQ